MKALARQLLEMELLAYSGARANQGRLDRSCYQTLEVAYPALPHRRERQGSGQGNHPAQDRCQPVELVPKTKIQEAESLRLVAQQLPFQVAQHRQTRIAKRRPSPGRDW